MRKICVECGREFEAPHGNVKVCSERCRRIRAGRVSMGSTGQGLRRAFAAERAKASAEYISRMPVRGTWRVFTCKVCGKKFRSNLKRALFCSEECRDISTERVQRYVEETERKRRAGLS